MGQAYTPGLKVARRMRLRVRRVLPIAGEVLVQPGEQVMARQVVAQTFMPGKVTPINLANLLSVTPADLPNCLLKHEGERIEVGEVLARTHGLFGYFQSEYKAQTSGTMETISKVTGQVILRGPPIPVEVRAYLAGEIVDVLPKEGVAVEAEASFVQGIFGVGGEAYGPIRFACTEPGQMLSEDLITPEMRGCIVIGGARMTGPAIKRAIAQGVSALVSGGMDDQDLRDILGYDLGVAVTGSEKIGITLIVTEGFGDIAMAERTFQLLRLREGSDAACNGATQIRAGVMRPEVVIPLGLADRGAPLESPLAAGALQIGRPVRIIREPYFGLLGTVAELPSEPQTLASGSKARVLRVRLDSGETVTVPRANVELMEG